MAALRARRAARVAEAATASKPKGVDPEIMAAAEAVGAPRQTWDEDYRERLAGTIESSDDEDDAIVVLPPPAIKLDPVASRVAWRKAQREAARVEAAELVRERFPAPAIISQPTETGPVEEVENEEQLLVEEEVEEEEDAGEEVPEEEIIPDEEDEEENNAMSDEEKLEENMDTEASEDDDDLADNTVDVDAETQPPLENGKNISCSASFDANAETQPPEETDLDTTAFALELVEDLISTSLSLSEKRVPRSGLIPKEVAAVKASSNASPGRTDSQRTVDSSRISLQTALESSSTIKSTRMIANNLRDTSIPVTQGRASGDEDDVSVVETTPQGKAVTVSSKGGFNFFKKFMSRSEPSSTVNGSSTLIDDEASEDDDDEDVEDEGAADSDMEEEEVMVDDCVERDAQETEAEAARLAEFHRQWEKGADDEAIRDAAKALGREKDVDDAMDLKELEERQKERDEQANQSEDDDAASFCMGQQEEMVDDADNYVENMFRDDDSDVEFGEETQATPEESKHEARAVWMARRKLMAERGAKNQHAISLLAFEGEVDDDENKANAERIRAQFDPKPAPEEPKTRKRRVIDGQTMNWLKRQSARVTVEKKRGSKVTLGKWFQSGPSDIVDTPTQTKTVPRVRAKKAPGPPVGGSAIVKIKARGAVVEVGQFKRRVQAKEAQSAPKPRSSLFQLLGELPKTDV